MSITLRDLARALWNHGVCEEAIQFMLAFGDTSSEEAWRRAGMGDPGWRIWLAERAGISPPLVRLAVKQAIGAIESLVTDGPYAGAFDAMRTGMNEAISGQIRWDEVEAGLRRAGILPPEEGEQSSDSG